MNNNVPNILIIDNDEGLVAALQARLEASGYNCSVAYSGAQGLSVFDADAIDLVITDLNMPAGDGVQLAESIRERSSVPIIIVTGFRDDYRKELRSIDDVSLVRKPFVAQDLLSLIEAELALCESDR